MNIVPLDQIPLAQDVPTENVIEIFKVITRLEALLLKKEGIGISAVQAGIPWKLFIVHRQNSIGKSPLEYYINCEYTPTESKEKITSIEGCLSLLNINGNSRRFEVQRYLEVLVTGKRLRITDTSDLVLEDFKKTEKGLYAIVFQHEIDHQFQRNKMIDLIGTEIDFS